MRDVADAVLPWLSGPLQWVALSLAVALVAASWVAVFSTTREGTLGISASAVVTTLSVVIGIGVLAIGRIADVALSPQFTAGTQQQGNGVMGAALTFAGEVAAIVFLLMGFALQMALNSLRETLHPGATTTSFRVIVGAGMALWIANEIITMIYVAHHGHL